MGVIQDAKLKFQAKICKFYVKIAAKLVNFSKCSRSARQFAVCMQNLLQKWRKGAIGRALKKKKGIIWCKIGVKMRV